MADLSGKTFNYWTVLEKAEDRVYPSGQKQKHWKCECRCGTIRNVHQGTLTGNKSKSCGCHAREVNTKHGMWDNPTYHTWHGMKQRTGNPKSSSWLRYGGRGITLCDEWQTFEGFLSDMGERPADTTLDRVDNSKGYSKENCRWASSSVQNHNRRSTGSSKYKGVSYSKLRDKWEAYIRDPNSSKRKLNLGLYSDEVEAAKVYDKAAIKYYGEYASLNFPKQ